MTTIGKYRHLCAASTQAGHFAMLAIDHRANLRDTLNKNAPSPISNEQFALFKQQVIRHLIDASSAVLADPMFGLGPGISSRIIPGTVGFLSPIEVTDYGQHPSNREIQYIPGWSVAKIKRMGGAGVKLLLPYHPEAENAGAKHEVVAEIVDECARHDIPFFLEPIAYSLDPEESLDSNELRRVVVGMARTFSEQGVDVLKMQFPVDANQETDESVWQEAAEELDAACGVPWALLSAGVDFETFARQARIACAAGASGVIVGRAVWAEATHLQGTAREEFLTTTARQRMEKLASVCAEYARPWYQRVDTPDTSLDWYQQYSE